MKCIESKKLLLKIREPIHWAKKRTYTEHRFGISPTELFTIVIHVQHCSINWKLILNDKHSVNIFLSVCLVGKINNLSRGDFLSSQVSILINFLGCKNLTYYICKALFVIGDFLKRSSKQQNINC